MQASGNSARTDFFYYARRFEPETFRNGRPKLWAAQLFSEEMDYRFCELQGYLSSAAKSKAVKSPAGGYGERCLSVETGDLWDPVATGISMDVAGDPRMIGSSVAHDKDSSTYLLATHIGSEAIIRPGKKPSYNPEMELHVIAESEGFCQDVVEIMETCLPRGITSLEPKRIRIERNGAEFDIIYSDGPLVGAATTVARARFG